MIDCLSTSSRSLYANSERLPLMATSTLYRRRGCKYIVGTAEDLAKFQDLSRNNLQRLLRISAPVPIGCLAHTVSSQMIKGFTSVGTYAGHFHTPAVRFFGVGKYPLLWCSSSQGVHASLQLREYNIGE